VQPLTLGTAGHIDHGKTALVHMLTGVDTDRLPEEKARGISIALGFAPLTLPSGRRLSLVDVPGHERLIRTMVSGATGIDLFLLTIAADDGVMPQTLEHVQILRALGIRRGVVAITKSDLADPGAAEAAAGALLPGLPIVACSARTGDGVAAVAAALERLAAEIPPRPAADGPAVLHVDRVFTITGAGTVVTGTLRAGRIAAGDRLQLLPQGRVVRVRGVQVHDAAVSTAEAGQRVAVNLTGVDRRTVARGDLLAGQDAAVVPTYRVEVRIASGRPPEQRARVQVHHGTRAVPGRGVPLADGTWQLRVEQPLLALEGDRVVIRQLNPPDTLGGGVIVHCGTRPRPEPDAPSLSGALGSPGSPVSPGATPAELDDGALELEQRLLRAGHEPLSEAELGADAVHLASLRAAGRAVRVGRSMYAHPDAIEAVTRTARSILEQEGSLTLARLRDELATSRKYAQALLEHLDSARVTRRLPDDRRVLRRGADAQSANTAGDPSG
jgi:selenocysteine-specific elongation factor